MKIQNCFGVASKFSYKGNANFPYVRENGNYIPIIDFESYLKRYLSGQLAPEWKQKLTFLLSDCKGCFETSAIVEVIWEPIK